MTHPHPVSEWLPEAVSYAASWLGHQVAVTDQPGCVLAVARDGAVVAEHAFGMADLARGTPLTPAHRFRVASHSKTFTAAAMLKLHEARRLHLDDPVGTHVDGLPPEVAAVTVAQLLSHSGGLTRDGALAPHWLDKAPFFAAEALNRELEAPPVLPPNSRFKYSNVGFGLAGTVIERLTGENYGTWVQREIVAPSGLDATTPDMPLPDGTPLATGHGARLPLGRRIAIPGHEPTHALVAATGFVSTAGDLARWIGSLDPAAAASVLGTASRREMTRRHWDVPDDAAGRDYGLGVIGGTLDGHRWFGHSGAFPGFISRTSTVPDWGVTVSIVTNAIDGLANPWVDGVLGILHRFSTQGCADPTVAGWTGRWWTLWGAFDLVPMGRTVLIGVPTQMQPFADAGEITVESPTAGRITRSNGFGSHGEPATRTLGPDGTATTLVLGGTELLPEAAFLRELAGRATRPVPDPAADLAPAAQP